jgi:transcriptional regulator with XRE-family HTH domain
MDINTQQNSIISEIVDHINKYLESNYVLTLVKKSGISRQILQQLRNGEKTGISLITIIRLYNAMGYKVDKITLSKIKEEFEIEAK